ncbi:apoptosis regulator BAX isoform X1 [Octopus vulgaris]|uniref:Apoptosis regulator BAX isoform X1 n=1 Tax=Octopus vulgaris TaxID=6645 RepID=A0AA36AP78_OCTVU|nr:apoptosis regulator BAX isoform X1 [Octopus vulgaris]
MTYALIAQEAKAVFLGFVQEKARLENEEIRSEAKDIISKDEVDANCVLVGNQLAEIGDKVYEEHRERFELMANLLNINSDSLVVQFINIVDLIKCSNLGRILVVFCFAYYLLKRFTKQIFQIILKCITNFVGISLARWIHNQGGWVSLFYIIAKLINNFKSSFIVSTSIFLI